MVVSATNRTSWRCTSCPASGCSWLWIGVTMIRCVVPIASPSSCRSVQPTALQQDESVLWKVRYLHLQRSFLVPGQEDNCTLSTVQLQSCIGYIRWATGLRLGHLLAVVGVGMWDLSVGMKFRMYFVSRSMNTSESYPLTCCSWNFLQRITLSRADMVDSLRLTVSDSGSKMWAVSSKIKVVSDWVSNSANTRNYFWGEFFFDAQTSTIMVDIPSLPVFDTFLQMTAFSCFSASFEFLDLYGVSLFESPLDDFCSTWRLVECLLWHILQVVFCIQVLDMCPYCRQPKHSPFCFTNSCLAMTGSTFS